MGAVLTGNGWGSRLEWAADGLRCRGPADPFIAAMARARNSFDRLFLATRALRKDPDCIEANLYLGVRSKDDDHGLTLLNIAVEAGDVLWGAAEAQGLAGPDWSAVPGAAPWLDSILELGHALVRAGDVDSARGCYDRLLAMDPSDGRGARAARERIEGAVGLAM